MPSDSKFSLSKFFSTTFKDRAIIEYVIAVVVVCFALIDGLLFLFKRVIGEDWIAQSDVGDQILAKAIASALIDRGVFVISIGLAIALLVLRLYRMINLYKKERAEHRLLKRNLEQIKIAAKKIHKFNHALRDCVHLLDLGYGQIGSWLLIDAHDAAELPNHEVMEATEALKADYNHIKVKTKDMLESALACAAEALGAITNSKVTACVKLGKVSEEQEGTPVIITAFRDSESKAERQHFDDIARNSRAFYLDVNSHYQELFDVNNNTWMIVFPRRDYDPVKTYERRIDEVWNQPSLGSISRPKTQAYIAIVQSHVISEDIRDINRLKKDFQIIGQLDLDKKFFVKSILYIDSDKENAFGSSEDDIMYAFADALYKVLDYRDRFLIECKPGARAKRVKT